MQSAQICGRKRGARVSGERRARKRASRRVFTGRGGKKKAVARRGRGPRPLARSRIPARVPDGAGQTRRASIARARLCVTLARRERADRDPRGGRTRTHPVVALLLQLAQDGRSLGRRHGRGSGRVDEFRRASRVDARYRRVLNTSSPEETATRAPLDRSRRTRPWVCAPRPRSRRSPRQTYTWPKSSGSIGATDFLSSRTATFEEETRRLTRRDTSRRAVSDLETPPCDAAKVRATARPGIAASSPSRARRPRRSRRLGTRRSRRVDAFGLGRSTTVGWRCARDREPNPSPHERRHSD